VQYSKLVASFCGLVLLPGHLLLAQADVERQCRSLPRSAPPSSLDIQVLDSIATAEMPHWEAHLSVIQAVGLEDGVAEPNPQADSLQQELREFAKRDSAGFRQVLLAAVRAGIHREVPELVANEAAVWYRQNDGRAGPVLAAIYGSPSDTWLLALSAINKPLSAIEEDVVAGAACDVGVPLLVARRNGVGSSRVEVRRRLGWVERSERILRHAERLVHGERRPLIAALIAGVQPTAVRLRPDLFNGPS
jgi:hypothetical protein